MRSRQKLVNIGLAIWMPIILIGYWLAQGAPGFRGIVNLIEKAQVIMQQFFSAPYAG